jgi:hypothetical protein
LASFGTADVLDEVIALNRLGNVAERAYAAAVERISAVVLAPRRFYVPESGATTTALGAPAFTLDGKFLGLFTMRSAKAQGGKAASGQSPESVTGIILPAEEILNAAKRVPAAEEKGK